MGKFNVWDKVEVINAGSSSLEDGDIGTITVIEGTSAKVSVNGKSPFANWVAFKDLKLVESKPTKKQRIEALEKRVGELELIVHELRERKVIVPSTDEVVGYKPFIPEPVKTPNQLRGEIIEKAKGFVEEKKNSYGGYEVDDNNDPFGFPFLCNLDFVVNEEKCTITALLRGMQTKNIYAKGIAKCNPSDVFNEHIGKAIALGRALGLDVSEFEGAVQPKEFAVGQVIRTSFSRPEQIEVITKIEKNSAYVDTGGFHYLSRAEEDNYKIINDTNAIYGGVE